MSAHIAVTWLWPLPPRIPVHNKILSLSQKSLAITWTAEVCTLNFFLSGDDWWCHSIGCLFVSDYSSQKSNSVFLIGLEKFSTDFFRPGLCSTVSIFGIHLAQTFLKSDSLMRVITTGIRIPTAAHSSLVVMHRSSESEHQPCLSSVCRHRGWSIAAGLVTTALLTALKTKDPACNWANVYGILTIHASQTCMNL